MNARSLRRDDLLSPTPARLAPVGIFDSCWGGLSVALAIRTAIPGQDLMYVGDHAWLPYGEHDAAVVRARSVALAGWLADRGCQAIVVACNTASSAALEDVRAAVRDVPVVGVVPAVKPAAARSRTGRIAVLATPATARGTYLARLVADHAPGLVVDVIPAPGLVEFVERGETDGPVVLAALRDLLEPSLAAGADAVVLGCTHYPFLRPAIERVCGQGVTVIDSGEAIARRVRGVLDAGDASRMPTPGRLDLLTSGDAVEVAPVACRLLGASVEVSRIEC